MDSIKDLGAKIDAAAAAQEQRIARLQQEGAELLERRRTRYRDLFRPALKTLQEIWQPRMQLLDQKFQALALRFGEPLVVTSTLKPGADEPHGTEMVFTSQSKTSKVRLQFSCFHDSEIRKLVLDCDLDIIPIYLKFEPHCRLEQPLEAIDIDALTQWLDERIVNFVRSYLSLHENPYYLGDDLVEDPIAHIRIPKFAAKSSWQTNGSTYYFISPETKREFQNQCAVS